MNLHDATLVDLTIEWATGDLTVRALTASGPAEIRALGVHRVEVPREHPWGPSVSINEVRLVAGLLEVEMQSGDQIRVKAREVQLP